MQAVLLHFIKPKCCEKIKIYLGADPVNSQPDRDGNVRRRSDLEQILNINIPDKKEFINTCNKIGLLVVDISPFPLNTKDTKINYGKNVDGSKKITKKEYRELVKRTIPTFFEKKMNLVSQKQSSNIKVFFRYTRVKNAFQDLISDILSENGLIKNQEDIGNISQKGGGIDRMKLKRIINDNDVCLIRK